MHRKHRWKSRKTPTPRPFVPTCQRHRPKAADTPLADRIPALRPRWPRSPAPAQPSASGAALVDFDQLGQHIQSILALALERVAPDDRAIAAAVADRARIVIDRIRALCRPAREHHDPPPGKACIHAVLHPRLLLCDVDLFLFINLLEIGRPHPRPRPPRPRTTRSAARQSLHPCSASPAPPAWPCRSFPFHRPSWPRDRKSTRLNSIHSSISYS